MVEEKTNAKILQEKQNDLNNYDNNNVDND